MTSSSVSVSLEHTVGAMPDSLQVVLLDRMITEIRYVSHIAGRHL